MYVFSFEYTERGPVNHVHAVSGSALSVPHVLESGVVEGSSEKLGSVHVVSSEAGLGTRSWLS